MINVAFDEDIFSDGKISSDTNEYSIIKELDRGVNGITYSALCLYGRKKGEKVAIKILHNKDYEVRLIRFLNEYSFIKSCDHKNIIKVFEFGSYCYKKEQYPFFVMPLYQTNLDKLINDNHLSLVEKTNYAVQILSAVKYLKDRHVIHRDLKPRNILINGENLAICDFGIVKQIEPWTEPGEMYGVDDYNRECVPYAFRSPEIVDYIKTGSKLTYHSDIFQLGLTFCMLFCGEHPLSLVGDYNKLEPIIFKKPLDDILSIINNDKCGIEISNIIKDMLVFRTSKMNESDLYLEKFANILTEFKKG